MGWTLKFFLGLVASCGVAMALTATVYGQAVPAPAPTAPVPAKAVLGITMSQTPGVVRILAVDPGSAAARAGLLVGDRIIDIDRQPVGSDQDVILLLAGRKPGDRVRLYIERGQLHGEMYATLGSADAVASAPSPTVRRRSLRPWRRPRATVEVFDNGALDTSRFGIPGSYDRSDEGTFGRGNVAD
ncbi:MAG TPA: PDZ domain-containing protein [Pirellulales bacterium]|jgi:predicted metalloprotease with PDZ domain|nr:PDZ domain-containing protein [Pirellulales bacterium]